MNNIVALIFVQLTMVSNCVFAADMQSSLKVNRMRRVGDVWTVQARKHGSQSLRCEIWGSLTYRKGSLAYKHSVVHKTNPCLLQTVDLTANQTLVIFNTKNTEELATSCGIVKEVELLTVSLTKVECTPADTRNSSATGGVSAREDSQRLGEELEESGDDPKSMFR